MAKLKLADVRFERSPFQPGDRVLVRTGEDIPPEQARGIRRAIDKMAGCEVRTMVVPNLYWRWTIRRDAESTVLCGPERVGTSLAPATPGVANVDITVVDLQPGDVLEITPLFACIAGQKEKIEGYIKGWAGPDVEILFLGS